MRPSWNPAAPPVGDSRVKLTYDDYLLFPEGDGLRHELIDGEHYVSPSPNLRHQRIIGRLHLLMAGWVERNRIGQVYLSPVDAVLSLFDVVVPDLLFVSTARAPILTTANVKGAPDLMIEVGSPSTSARDETIKRRLYERSNVVEYWIVDPEIDTIRVYRRSSGSERFDSPIALSREDGDVLTTPLLPGLDIPLARVFED